MHRKTLSRQSLLELDEAARNLEHKLRDLVDLDAYLQVTPGEGLKVAVDSSSPGIDPEPDVLGELPSSSPGSWWISRPEGAIVIGRPYAGKDSFCCECNAEINPLDSLALYCRSYPICPQCASQYHLLMANLTALVNSLGQVLGNIVMRALGVAASGKGGIELSETEERLLQVFKAATASLQNPSARTTEREP